MWSTKDKSLLALQYNLNEIQKLRDVSVWDFQNCKLLLIAD